MRFPGIRGISAAYQHALIETMRDLLAAPELDFDVARRADWLKQGLEGRRPESEPLPFVDSGPLVPAIGRGEELVPT